ncbi:MAG: ATP-binding protein [Bacillota bacterium]
MNWSRFKLNNLFSKLLLRFLVVSLIIIIVLGSSTIYFFKRSYYENKETEIINNSKVMTEFLVEALQKEDKTKANNWLQVIAKLNSGQAWIVDDEGYLTLSYPTMIAEGQNKINFLNLDDVLEGNIISQRIESSYFERPMLLIGFPLSLADDNTVALLVFTSVAGINSTINLVQRMMFYSSILAILLAMIISYLWSRSLAAPLSKLNSVALEFSKGNFGKEVEVDSYEELDNLAESMNYLSTELQSTIKDLTKERNKLKHILTGMEEGLLAVDETEKIILVNGTIKDLFNLTDDNLIGLKLTTVIANQQIESIFQESLTQKEPVQEEVTLVQGRIEQYFLIHCTPIYIDKELWGVVGLFQDISERWRFEQLQKDFVANVSHELKAPLTSIKGSTEVMLDGVVDSKEDYDNYLQIILEETNRLTELVDEILQLAEYESNNSGLVLTEVQVNYILDEVATIFRKGNFDRGFDFKLNYLTEEVSIRVDQQKIKQVLLNLLDNAYKFLADEQQSWIELGASLIGKQVKFWVQDNGVGIPETELQNIWERFYKVDKAHTPSQQGSGLGLSIVQWIVEQHGGEVFVDSELGNGSTFGFYLDLVD